MCINKLMCKAHHLLKSVKDGFSNYAKMYKKKNNARFKADNNNFINTAKKNYLKQFKISS